MPAAGAAGATEGVGAPGMGGLLDVVVDGAEMTAGAAGAGASGVGMDATGTPIGIAGWVPTGPIGSDAGGICGNGGGTMPGYIG